MNMKQKILAQIPQVDKLVQQTQIKELLQVYPRDLVVDAVRNELDKMRDLDEQYKANIAADESLQNEEDAELLASPPRACGIFNIKLMKSGGISSALRIASIAALANIDLMWGCMDESRISIAAALHAALACPNTKYLDLDGSLDLASDVAAGGFEIESGMMRALNRPGLGLSRIE